MACINVTEGGNGMGLGRLGDPDIVHKRKFRWFMEIYYCNFNNYVPGHFVKTASRPNITIEEIEINFLNEKTWIPGKGAWEQITVSYFDVSASDNNQLFNWLATVYDFTDRTCRHMASRRSDYVGVVILSLLDGCGNIMETWGMGDAWPTSIKFGELDMSSNEICDIEMTMRYSKVSYQNFCFTAPITRCPCTPCGQQPARAVNSANFNRAVASGINIGTPTGL